MKNSSYRPTTFLSLVLVWLNCTVVADEAIKLLTDVDGEKSQIVWSPKGDAVAFLNKTKNGTHLVVYQLGNLSGSKWAEVGSSVDLGIANSYAFDKSGTLMAIERTDGGPEAEPRIEWPVHAALSRNYKACRKPVFPADGSKLAYIKSNRAFVVSSDASAGDPQEQVLTKEGMLELSLATSGKGFFLTGNGILWYAEPGTGEKMILKNAGMGTGTGGMEYYIDLAVSPDGKRIVLVSSGGQSASGASTSLILVNSDGTNKKQIGTGQNPTWSPDSRKFAYSLKGDLMVYSVDSREKHSLTKQSQAGHSWPSWSPDGKSIAFSARLTDTSGDGKIDWRDSPAIYLIDVSKGFSAASTAGGSTQSLLKRVTFKPIPTKSEQAKSVRNIVCPAFHEPPKIDGKLDDEAWKTANIADEFQLLGQNRSALRQTEVRIGFDAANFYVAYECFEKDFSRFKATVKERDVGKLWNDDCVELFFDPNRNQKQLYQWMFNAIATVWDAHHVFEVSSKTGKRNETSSVEWNSDAVAAAEILDDRWVVETRIPFKNLNAPPPKEGTVWGANFNRHQLGLGETSNWSRLSGKRGNHDPEGFGNLIFGDPSALLESWHPGAPKLGKNEVQVQVRSRRDADVEVNLKLSVNGTKAETKKVRLAPSEASLVTMGYAITDRSPGKLELLLLGAEGKEIISKEAFSYEPPEPLEVHPASRIYIAGPIGAKVALKLGVSPASLDGLSLRLELLDSKSRLLRSCDLTRIESTTGDIWLDLNGMSPGEFTLVSQLNDNGGQLLSEVKTSINIAKDPYDF